MESKNEDFFRIKDDRAKGISGIWERYPWVWHKIA